MLKKSLLSLLLFVGLFTLASATNLVSYKATYKVKAGEASGYIDQTLNISYDHYRFNSVGQIHFMFYYDTVIEQSLGLITRHAVRPQAYTLSDDHNNQFIRVKFKPSTHSAEVLNNNEMYSLTELNPNVQDNLSYQLMIAQDLLNQSHATVYEVIHRNAKHAVALAHYQYTGPTKTHIDTPIGPMNALKLVRHGKDNSVETYWYAPAYHDLLVKSEAINAQGKLLASIIISSYQKGRHKNAS